MRIQHFHYFKESINRFIVNYFFKCYDSFKKAACPGDASFNTQES